MPLDPIPASSQSDGKWKIAYVPSGNPLSVAIIKGASSKNLTYSFTPDGFNWATTQAEVADPRLTLVQDLSRPGKKKETLETKYVDSSDANAAATVLAEGTSGFFVVRRGTDNATDWTVGDKVDVITFTAGAQRPDAPTENGVDTISQTQYITSVTQRKVTLIA
ncbi:hypothetical protein [Microbacterium oxydans]|uniref:phage tail tube protein n=1 Tax=Microbacterium oxydans TaxID=82380 RepID=UPI0037C5B431